MNYGYKYFTIKDHGKKRKIYKFNYYFSNVGECFVLCFYYWLPESKRKKVENCFKPQFYYSTPWCVDCRGAIKFLTKKLQQTGHIDLDEIDFTKGKKWF
jgi:hypothetical protein